MKDFKNWKLDYKRLFIAILISSLIISNFYLLLILNKNIKIIGEINLIIFQQNELILKNIKYKYT